MSVTLDSRLGEIARKVGPTAVRALRPHMDAIALGAKARVPVETGALQRAIHVDSEPNGYSVVAGDRDVFYGHLVEHGTRHSPPHPFLVPAFEAEKPPLLAGVAKALGDL